MLQVHYNFIEDFLHLDTTKPKKEGLLHRVLPYATEQRLTSAISKVGAPVNEDIEGEICDEYLTDLFTDVFEYEPEFRNEWESASEVEKCKVNKVIKQKTTGLLKKYKNSR